jgi:hypothetical protein
LSKLPAAEVERAGCRYREYFPRLELIAPN